MNGPSQTSTTLVEVGGIAGVAAGIGAGALMGFVISALGAGGSIFTVPLLLYGFHESVAVATGTSLSVVFAAATVGAWGHYRQGHVRGRVAVAFAGGSLLTAPIGALLHPFVSDRFTVALFALVLLVAAARMFAGNRPDGESAQEHRLRVLVPLGALVGLLTGFLGVGGGFVIVPVLAWGARLPVKHAVGTSLLVIALTSAAGASTYAIRGLVSVPLLLSVGGGAVLGALLGAPFGAHVPERPLRLGFAAVAVGVAVFMGYRAVSG